MNYSYGYLSGFASNLFGQNQYQQYGFQQQQDYGSIYQGQLNQINRDLDWVRYQLQRQIDITDRVWIAATNVETTRSINPSLTIASISVPAPPEGYGILLEAWVNASWGSTTALDAAMKLEVGGNVIAETDLSSDSTVGSINPVLSTVYTASQTTNFSLEIDYTADETELTLKNRGIRARFVREGAFDQAQFGFLPVIAGDTFGLSLSDTLSIADAVSCTPVEPFNYTIVDDIGFSDTVSATIPVTADWYVSSTGDNANDGTARDDAFLTIAYAMGTASTGESILVLAGTYAESVEVTVPSVTMSGDTSVTGRPHVHANFTSNHVFYDTASNADAVTIQGFEVSSASEEGIIVDNGSTGWSILDNHVHHCTDVGIWVFDGNSHLVQNNRVYLIKDDNDGESFGVRLGGGCTNSTVDSNVFYLIQKAATRDRGDNNTWTNNYTFASYAGNQLNYYEGGNIIQNNMMEHVQRAMVFKHYDGNQGMSTVKHNECIDCSDAGITFGIDGAPVDYAASIEMTYNFLATTGTDGGYVFVKEGSNDVSAGMTLDFNMYYPQGSTPDYYFYDTDSAGKASQSVAEIVSNTTYEDNGTEYNAGTRSNYGNQTTVSKQGAPDWVPISVTADSASHNGSDAPSAFTWHWLSDWNIGTTGAAWIIADCGAGTSTSFDYVLLQPYLANSAVKTYSIEVSDNKADWTTVHSASTYSSKNTMHIIEVDTPTAGRYFRFNFTTAQTATNMTVGCLEFGNLV
jgi:hypothetical protein